MPTRRGLLKTGGASVLVAGLGATGYAWFPGTSSATAPWRAAGESFGDPRLDSLAYAILAPNPHNRQPWWFELVGDDSIDVYVDTDRLLPHTDPLNRQITVGFGCMLELLRQAAAEKGFAAQITPFPDGAPYPNLNGDRMAQVQFVAGRAQVDPLFTSVLQRRSLKEPFDTHKPVSAETLATVASAAENEVRVGSTSQANKTKRLIDLAWLGWMIEYETAATRRESIDLMRIGNRAVAKNPDGIDLGGLPMGLMKMTGIITPKSLDTLNSTAYNTGIDMYREMVQSSQGFVWIITPDNSRESQLQAGQSWVRINLAAQAERLGIHPLSQILQEFPEMAEPYARIHDELGANGGTVQMLGRVGYAKFPGPSPRWPLESKLITKNA